MTLLELLRPTDANLNHRQHGKRGSEEVETCCRGDAGLPKGQSAHKESPVAVEEVHLHANLTNVLLLLLFFLSGLVLSGSLYSSLPNLGNNELRLVKQLISMPFVRRVKNVIIVSRQSLPMECILKVTIGIFPWSIHSECNTNHYHKERIAWI